MENDVAKHPAKFTNCILDEIAQRLNPDWKVLDCFGGAGKLKDVVSADRLFLNEIEYEWACQGLPANVIQGNALYMPFPKNTFDAVITSPVYGNRMSDSFHARDSSRRNTYTHVLGRELHPQNSGKMQWGEKYRNFHLNAWKECARVLKKNGTFILNISNHIRDGKEIPVTEWHVETLVLLGFLPIERVEIETPRQKFGANANLRVKFENLIIFNLC